MAFIHLNFRSKVLMCNTDVNVILPDDDCTPFKTLFLLHGLHGDYSAWVRNTRIEQYAKRFNIAVVMPSAGNSFYTDMKFGGKYYTHIANEITEYTRKIFPLSRKREDTFIAGASMGGYGAIKIALKNPEMFCAAASLSGCLDIESVAQYDDPMSRGLLYLIMGNTQNLHESDENVIYLAKKLALQNTAKPKIYQTVGTEDFLYKDNITFKNAVEPLWDVYKYEESVGAHTWDFWDAHIPKMFEFFLG